MAKNAVGKMVVATVTLKPEAKFSGDKLPTRADIDAMHHEAHDECFIANSVKTDVHCEPVYVE
jgi:organic hydroperoxide reductase OsmC/OhrA